MGMGMLLSLIVGLIAIYMVIKPLVVNDSQEKEWISLDNCDQLDNDAAFAVLAEIEYDYQMGKMSEEDYLSLQQKYQRQAIWVLQGEENKFQQPRTDGEERQLEAALAAELEKELNLIRKTVKTGKA